jgi:hypothetical protein
VRYVERFLGGAHLILNPIHFVLSRAGRNGKRLLAILMGIKALPGPGDILITVVLIGKLKVKKLLSGTIIPVGSAVLLIAE